MGHRQKGNDAADVSVAVVEYSIIKLFFFFKQKTAYEMRISDWSSDVCSSDLASLGLGKTFFRQFDRFGSGGSHTFSASKHDHEPSIAQTDKRSHPRRQ